MNNEHSIKDLDLLYSDAKRLVNEVVNESIDGDILKYISSIIEDFNKYWRGEDATIQVNNLIDIKNKIIENRNIIGNIGEYISMLVINYRDAQNSNGIVLPSFPTLSFNKLEEIENISTSTTEIFMNNEINNVTSTLNNIINTIEELNTSLESTKTSIFNNWVQEDENRIYASKMFTKVNTNNTNIINGINDVINNINTSIENYKNTTNKISSMPTLESMIEDKPITNNIEQSEVIKSIETNIQKNKELNTTFKNRVYEELKKELIDKGYVE